MTDITKITEALRIGWRYAQEVLSNHDQWAQGHPATLDSRKAITDDIDAIKSALESLDAAKENRE